MIKFELVTLNGTKLSEDVYELRLPTPDGEIGVLQHHMPLVSIASPGIIKVRAKANTPDDLMDYYVTNGGVIEILDNHVRMLVDEADHSDELNEAEVKKAHEQALRLKADAKDQQSLAEAQKMLDRTATRLKVAELKRHRRKKQY